MKTKSAFTLIELLVVIAIIAILTAILFPVFAPATNMALIYSLFPVAAPYTTTESLDPYTPYAPAQTYQLVADLTSGMTFTSLDPFGTGISTLSGNNDKLWAWIDEPGYSNGAGSTFAVSGFPVGTTNVSLYGWDGFNGPRQTVPNSGQSSVTFTGLAEGQTYMVVATATPITSGLVAWYRLDETTGKVAHDSSGNAHNATVTGATWNPTGGKFNGCVALPGASSAAVMPKSLLVNIGSAISVSCWFKTSAPGVLVGEQSTAANGTIPTSYAPDLYVDSS